MGMRPVVMVAVVRGCVVSGGDVDGLDDAVRERCEMSELVVEL